MSFIFQPRSEAEPLERKGFERALKGAKEIHLQCFNLSPFQGGNQKVNGIKRDAGAPRTPFDKKHAALRASPVAWGPAAKCNLYSFTGPKIDRERGIPYMNPLMRPRAGRFSRDPVDNRVVRTALRQISGDPAAFQTGSSAKRIYQSKTILSKMVLHQFGPSK